MCFSLCQGSPLSATLFFTFEEHVCQTSSVRQAAPPECCIYQYVSPAGGKLALGNAYTHRPTERVR